jgi:hypothetical protein
MTSEERVAFINAHAAAALVELEAMKAANYVRKIRGESPAYSEDAIRELISIHYLDEKSLQTYLKDGY